LSDELVSSGTAPRTSASGSNPFWLINKLTISGWLYDTAQ
jgi:hypothetical protein